MTPPDGISDEETGLFDPTGFLSAKLTGKLNPSNGSRGVWAKEGIVKGGLLAVWGGRIITGTTLKRLPRDQVRLALQVEEDLYMLSLRESHADWINHSCAPNAGYLVACHGR